MDKNDLQTLLLVLYLSQNRGLMEQISPVLSFLEQHKDGLNILKKVMFPREEDTKDKKEAQPDEREKDSPLQSVATREVLQSLTQLLQT